MPLFLIVFVFQDFAAADIGIETRNQLTEALYNELMVAILKILDKLDLTSTAPAEVNDLKVTEYLSKEHHFNMEIFSSLIIGGYY